MKSLVVAAGRFNPPTAGHEFLIKTLVNEARKHKATPVLIVIEGKHTGEDKVKNPLSGKQRKHFLKLLFPGLKVIVARNPYFVFETMKKLKFDIVAALSGADRDYAPLLARTGHENAKIVTLHRDPEASGVQGISATKAKQAAMEKDYAKFASMMPSTSNKILSKMIYNAVVKGMKS